LQAMTLYVLRRLGLHQQQRRRPRHLTARPHGTKDGAVVWEVCGNNKGAPSLERPSDSDDPLAAGRNEQRASASKGKCLHRPTS
jgi:hypothetical protein